MDEATRAKIQEKLNKINGNNTNTQFQSNTWKLKPIEKGQTEGPESNIRLINYPFTPEEDPFPELAFHYNVGSGPGILCPKFNAGKSCPICEFAAELRAGSDKDKELAKTLNPSNRYYAVVVDRDDEEAVPKFWGFGVTVYRELLGKLVNPEYSHFLNTESGIDLTVKFVKDAKRKWPNTDISFSRRDTPLAKDEASVQEILKSIKPIDEVFKPITTAEIKKRLNDWLSFGEDEAEEESGETVVGSNGNGATNTVRARPDSEPEAHEVDDVEAAFEEALANAR